jgi:flagellar basal body-associated protein FliL
MKITRKTLLIIIAVLGVLLIAYGVIRHFTDFGEGEVWDRYVTDVIVVIALGLFIYNRKMAKDEKQAKEAEVREEAPDEAALADDEEKPHWERGKK